MTKPLSTVLPNYSLLIDWQLRQRNMAKQERRRRSDAEQMLRQFKTNQNAIVCPCPRPNKTSLWSAFKKVAMVRKPSFEMGKSISSKFTTNKNDGELALKERGFVKSLTRYFSKKKIDTGEDNNDKVPPIDDSEFDECLSLLTKETVCIDSEDECLYGSEDDDDLDVMSVVSVRDSRDFEQHLDADCKNDCGDQILDSFLRELNFMNDADDTELETNFFEYGEALEFGKTIFDCLFPMFAKVEME
eukprot:CAMPEP_0172478750 /NCGR_PEP_ID=MMETSP1066-20121228/2907_1 /TAXON_ID=671091 /ORGANISM="Coscinodiscus wailesii, Strain CCMP2513" /LENGTH=244 /DNA_ID=CAMNT_0013238591 /DNA_START=531 /DNA_END=1265 /DNA_ORIENTATION=-